MIYQLQIHQTLGRIGISQSPATIKMTQPPADLNIHQQPADLEIQTEEGNLNIDQSACFADEGLMSSGQLERKAAQEGQKSALAYIEKTAMQGEQIKSDKHNRTAIAKIAYENSRPPTHVFNVGLIPSSPPTISYKPAEVRIKVDTNSPNMNVNTHRVQLQVEQGGVNVKMEQYPSISIQVVGSQLDARI